MIVSDTRNDPARATPEPEIGQADQSREGEPRALRPTNQREFRDVLSCCPTGVCAITASSGEGERLALLVGSFVSISLSPPLVGFFPDKTSSTWPKIKSIGRFCVNILASHQLGLCSHLSSKGEDKLARVAHCQSPAGHPLFEEALAWIDCSVERVAEIGDHWLVVGAVEGLGMGDPRTPLTFFRGGYYDLLPVGRAALVTR